MASSGDLLVAAIDIGTTYSGAACSFRSEYKENPTKIHALKIGNPRLSLKCPTFILIEPDGETCHSFGDEAAEHYGEKLEHDERKKWYFFKRFKMMLYDRSQDEPLLTSKLNDECGKPLRALKVFSLSIKYLKDKIVQDCNVKKPGLVKESDIFWVLTVPAIWDDQAKAFMRKAAEETGIARDKLAIALEPEAASIYCQYIPIVRDPDDITKLAPFRPGKKYVVLDCGGGTVDITVHEVIKGMDGKHYQIKELDKARGNNMGGTKVDKAIMDYLKSLFGTNMLQSNKQIEEADYWELLKAIEDKKRNIKGTDDTVTFSNRIFSLFKDAIKRKLEGQQAEMDVKEVTITGDKLRIRGSRAQSFFKESIDSIVQELRNIFSTSDADCVTILMVGGYSECPLLQKRIKEEFPDKELSCPVEASLAVLKGAVIFGHRPSAMAQRISKYTYGIEVDGNRGQPEFSKLVGMNQLLLYGEAQYTNTYQPGWEGQTEAALNVYSSPKIYPKRTDEEGCKCIASFILPLPPVTKYKSGRAIEVRMLFGGTEFTVEVKSRSSGNVQTFLVDCLE